VNFILISWIALLNPLLLFLSPVARGFVQRRKFHVLLAAKREQEKHVAEFLSKLPKGGDQLYSKQKELCRADESRPKGEEVSVSLCLCLFMYLCVHLCAD